MARQLVNVLPVRGGKDRETKAKLGLKHTGLYILERVDGVKKARFIVEPKLTFKVTTREREHEFFTPPPLFVPLDATFDATIPYWSLTWEVAKYLGPVAVEHYEWCQKNNQFRAMKQIFHSPILHGCDVDICDHYISKYLQKYSGNGELDAASPLTKAFWDIEVDSINIPGFPIAEEAPCPINLIGYFDQTSRTLYQYGLRNENNPLIAEFEANLPAYIAEIRERFEGIRCVVRFFDEELLLIKAWARQLNETDRPDVLLAWNASFDSQTVINRIKNLGAKPPAILCPEVMDPGNPDEAHCKQVEYVVDTRATDISEKKDQMNVTSWTMWMDQMVQYAIIRKSMGKKDSYSLDAILAEELGERKDEVVGNMKTFPYRDFKKFMHYNAQDVMGCYKLERKTGDIDLLYQISLMTETRISKAMTKTTCLRNMAAKFFREQGFALSNNRNQDYGKEEHSKKEKFRGAFVANPTKLGRSGIELLGSRSDRVFEKVCDLDLASLYPSIIMAFNVDGSTQIGKMIIPGDVAPASGVEERLAIFEENKMNEDIDRLHKDCADAFVDSLQARDYVSFGRKWFDLPSTIDIMKELGYVA